MLYLEVLVLQVQDMTYLGMEKGWCFQANVDGWIVGICRKTGIYWKWQAMDGVITKAPLGEKSTGPNPTDRAKSGTNEVSGRW